MKRTFAMRSPLGGPSRLSYDSSQDSFHHDPRTASVLALGELTLQRLREAPADAFVIIYRDTDRAAFDAITTDRQWEGHRED